MKKLILSVIIALPMFFTNLIQVSNVENDKILIVEAEPIPSELHRNIIVIEPIPTPDPVEVALKEIEQKLAEIESVEVEKEWFIAYKGIINEYYGILDPPETVWDYFTEDEVRLICRVVETETYDQDFMSKVNVANVVLNRYYSGDFGETITEIVTSPYQFAYGRKNITEDTILAVMYAFEIKDTTDGALFFHSNAKTDTFCGANYIFTDNCGHHFYK